MTDRDHLDEFANAASADGLREAVVMLIKKKELNRVVDAAGFRNGLERLVRHAGNPSGGVSRLTALSALARITAVAKSTQTVVESQLTEALRSPLPALQTVVDPDDRYYAAKMWRYARAAWMPSYFAEAAVEEEAGENARLETLLGLLTTTGNLAASFSLLGVAVQRLRFDTQKPGDSRGRRVRKILSQLVKAAEILKVQPGEGVGTALARMLSESIPHRSVPESEEVKEDLVEEVAGLVDYAVSARLSLATEADTYAALSIAREWFRVVDWADVAERSAALKSVMQDVHEGLRIVVRAGLTDDGLYQALAVAAGSEESARSHAIGLEESLPLLSDDVRSWLRGRSPKRSSTLASEEQARSADELLAALFLDLKALSLQAEVVKEEIAPELQVMAPRTAPILGRFLGTAASAIGKMELLAARRGLRMRGEVGAVVEFSPLEHEMVGGFVPGTRFVRLLAPIVEASVHGDLSRVVRRALVQPAKDSNQ